MGNGEQKGRNEGRDIVYRMKEDGSDLWVWQWFVLPMYIVFVFFRSLHEKEEMRRSD